MTWTCDQIEVRLSDYLDGLLQGSERIAFAEHLAKCPECALLASTLHNLLNEMHSMDEVEAPPHLVQAVGGLVGEQSGQGLPVQVVGARHHGAGVMSPT